MRRYVAALVAACLGVAALATTEGSATSATSTTSSTPTTTPPGTQASLACAQKLVANWSVAKLANETIAVSMNAMNVGALGAAARAGFGAFLLLGSSAPAKLSGILSTLQRERRDTVRTLVMTDAEGGGVERLTNVLAKIPWAQTMGRNLSDAQITAEGRRLGATMLAQGLNVDLAPVADLDARAVMPGARDADGYRSYSGDPATAARDVVAFERGLEAAGVLGVAKHFPGLGGSSMNTDYGPAHTLVWATLQTSALIPFKAMAGTKAMVMTSNASVPGLTGLPASISPVVTKYIRSTMGFQGLIMTDSLSAGALSARHLSVAQASLAALQAGADLVLAGAGSSPSASIAQANATSLVIQNAVATQALSLTTLQDAAAQVVSVRSTLSCSS